MPLRAWLTWATVVLGGCTCGTPIDAAVVVPDAFTAPDASAPRDAPCPATCIDVPAGFAGPVVLATASPGTAPTCPPQIPDVLATGYGEVTDAPVDCAPCACAPRFNFMTTGSTAWAATDCSGAPMGVPTNVHCVPYTLAEAAHSARFGIDSLAPAGDGCGPGGGTVVSRPAAAVPETLACGHATRACGALRCLRADTTAPLCVMASGDVPCPTGLAERHVLAAAPVDDRTCAACACDPGAHPAGLPEDFVLMLYADDACSSAAIEVPSSAWCQTVDVPASGSTRIDYHSSSTCTPTGGGPTGHASASPDHVTVCCPG